MVVLIAAATLETELDVKVSESIGATGARRAGAVPVVVGAYCDNALK
jgi:hypothetical protein